MLEEQQEAQVVLSGPTWGELVNAKELDIYRSEDMAAAIRQSPVDHSAG